MLNQLCIPDIIDTCSDVLTFSYFIKLNVLIFCLDFASVLIQLLICSFPYCIVFFCSWLSG